MKTKKESTIDPHHAPTVPPYASTLFPEAISRWQAIVDLIAQAVGARAVLIITFHARQAEVLVSSQSAGSLYRPGDRADFGSSLYADSSLVAGRELLVVDARSDPRWARCSDFSAGVLSCLGVPLSRADGAVFGALCVLNDKEDQSPDFAWAVVRQCRAQIELELKLRDDLAGRENELDSLRKDRDLVSAILDTADALVVVLGLDGQILRFNRTCERATKYSAAEVRGKYLWDLLLLPEETDAVKAVFRQLRVGQFPNQHENYWLTRDGDRRLIAWSNTALLGSDGRVECIIGTGIDITDRRRAEQEREKLKEHVYKMQKMEAIGQLASGVAHDFKNLLTIVLGCTEQLLKTPEPDEVARRTLLNSIDHAARQASGVTRSLLTISRDLSIEKHPVLLSTVIEEGTALLRHTLPSTIELKVDTAGDAALWVDADPAQLQQVILNLVINSRDAMPDGGVLSISVSPAETASQGRQTRTPAFARISVRDTGVGMPPEVRSRIFEPFFTTKPRGYGTGLGLIMVESIVKAHGGSISVESQAGQGTTVQILLPCLPTRAALGRAAPPQYDSPAGRELVLLLADATALRGIMVLGLRSQGFEVIHAADERSAWETCHYYHDAIRAIVVDADACQAGGVEWLREMKQPDGSAPAVVIVGSNLEDVGELDIPNIAFLSKPFQPADLGKAVEQLTRGHSAHSEVTP
ncbi:MAG TPA: ATP-binding protein [Phycisphaerae bacterium]|nr:ATP-binding protein [Phycisphaerae bacterium]